MEEKDILLIFDLDYYIGRWKGEIGREMRQNRISTLPLQPICRQGKGKGQAWQGKKKKAEGQVRVGWEGVWQAGTWHQACRQAGRWQVNGIRSLQAYRWQESLPGICINHQAGVCAVCAG